MKHIKNFFLLFLSLTALTIWAVHVSAWIGLEAEDGDILSFTKWNELIDYIDTKVDFLYVDQQLSLKQDTIYADIDVDIANIDLTNYQEGDLIKDTNKLDYTVELDVSSNKILTPVIEGTDLSMYYTQAETDAYLDLKADASQIITDGGGDKFLSDTGNYIAPPREVYPYLTSSIDEQLKVSETKSITISGVGFTPADVLEGLEADGYVVEYISKSPTEVVVNITAPDTEVFASEYSFSGHEAWWNGKKITLQTVDLFAENLMSGTYSNCFQKYNGDLYCAGQNNYTQLAIAPGDTSSPITTPTAFSVKDVTKLQLIYNTAFALGTDKKLRMWGRGVNGIFGLETSSSTIVDTFDTEYLDGELIRDFDVGSNTMCAIRDSDGKVYCSGYSSSYYDIPGKTSQQNTPVYISSMSTSIQQLSMSQRSGCYITTSGYLYCWGWDNGRFGRGTTDQKLSSPTYITRSIAKVDSGYGYHTCILTTSAQVKCAGYNSNYQTGKDSNTTERVSSWYTVPLVDPIDIALGENHSIALQSNGEVKVWGKGSSGQLGNGSTTTRVSDPVNVQFEDGTNITTAVKISAGLNGGCAILEDSSVYCWGRNDYGQLGDGTTTNSLYAKPVTSFAFE